MNLQFDLFGQVQELQGDALTVLALAHPNTLQLVIGDRRPDPSGEVKASALGSWAYRVDAHGLHHEPREDWSRRGGWSQRPAHHTPWEDTDALIGTDPRLDQIRAWAESLTAVDKWRDLYRPFELWPDPESWHPSYIEGDHNRPGWQGRLHHWQLAIAVCLDARSALL